MKKKLNYFVNQILDRNLDFRVRLFYVLALAGIGISVATVELVQYQACGPV